MVLNHKWNRTIQKKPVWHQMFVIVTCPYAWGLKDSFKDEICTIEDVPQLN